MYDFTVTLKGGKAVKVKAKRVIMTPGWLGLSEADNMTPLVAVFREDEVVSCLRADSVDTGAKPKDPKETTKESTPAA